MSDILIGDHVVPVDDEEHDVMTVYDFELGGRVALCNWMIGTTMIKAKVATAKLMKVESE